MVAPGSQRAQCFGCGTTIDLGRQPSTATSKDDGSKVPTAKIALIVLGTMLLLAIIGFSVVSLMRGKAEPVVAKTEPPEVPVIAAAPEPMVPAFVATEEERRLAASVSESDQTQIMKMWDQMTATTQKKLLIPRRSVMRDRVETMLSAIEQREITTMSALLEIERDAVAAVIQVAMADRAAVAVAEAEAEAIAAAQTRQ
jgi:flagellar basal body-associated protein FliL